MTDSLTDLIALTDLLAAHRLDDTDGTCTGCDWTWPDSSEIDMYTDLSLIHPAHVAEVVEQRTGALSALVTELEAELRRTSNNLDVARMGRNSAEAKLAKVRSGASTLGEVLHHLNSEVLEAVGRPDVIGEDGDGDWEYVYDLLAELRPDRDKWKARALAAEAAIARVKAIHQPEEREPICGNPECVCSEPKIACSCTAHHDDWPDAYPCATVRALEGGEPC